MIFIEWGMFFYPTVLTIAGSDCSGGAGIQADIKTMSALGIYAASVLTSITVQNTSEVKLVQAVNPQVISDQIRAVMTDLDIRFAKIGMVNDATSMEAIAGALDFFPIPHLVIDPVMVSSSGMPLMQAEAIPFFCSRLVPKASLLTPNIPEAEILSSMHIRNEEDKRMAANRIMNLGCPNILIKGGHSSNYKKTDSLFVQDDKGEDREYSFSNDTVPSNNTHGTGCTLSAAIVSYLARDFSLVDAVALAKEYVHTALKEGMDVKIGKGTGPLNHFFAPEKLIKNKLNDD